MSPFRGARRAVEEFHDPAVGNARSEEQPPQRTDERSAADEAKHQGDDSAETLGPQPEPHDVAAEDHHDQPAATASIDSAQTVVSVQSRLLRESAAGHL